MDTASPPPTGSEIIRRALEGMPLAPGVYRMLDAQGAPLYVGKAVALRNRVSSYANPAQLPLRLQRMVMATAKLEYTIAASEAEALLLEANLIKALKPRYNILLRDDKSYPYIRLSGHAFPQIAKYRGAKEKDAEYFGPYVSTGAVNETLAILQKAFLLRPCADTVFKNRTRPCLQYQIKRCSAPCVGKVSEEEYAALAAQARRFLSGRGSEILQQLTAEMERAAEAMDYEQAALLRDRLRALSAVQQEGRVSGVVGDADVFALTRDGTASCVQVAVFRAGRQCGVRAFFPAHTEEQADADVLGAALGQFYQRQPPPPEIYVSHALPETPVLEEALSLLAGCKVSLIAPQRGEKLSLVRRSVLNAQEALRRHTQESVREAHLLEGVAGLFGLPATPARIEVYDNSHVMGTNAVGAMVVAGAEGFERKAYRVFNMRGAALTPGDDYAMLREVLTRRFRRLLAEEAEGGGVRPDLLLIDGGAGQLSAALQALEELGVADMPLAAIAKGQDRNAGREWFHLPGREPFQLPVGHPVLHYLQRLRDEAHRFAIGAHRGRRSHGATRSNLDALEGVGAVRKKALLVHFGSGRAVAGASEEEIARVPGINRALAKRIYRHFHE